MLIDGGNKEDSDTIYSILKDENVQKLDIVVGTHAHEDHIGGLPGAFSYTTANLTLCPVTSYDSEAFSDFAEYANTQGGGITVPSVGDTYELGSAKILILGVNSGTETNDTSIVLKITYGDTSFLFTGDAEKITEDEILNSAYADELQATVLKVGHHGGETSTSYHFLREIMPQYAIISVGQDNVYGHPTADTLSRLRDADVTVYRTDMQGDITCSSDGKNVTITPTKNAEADTLSQPGSYDKIPTDNVNTTIPETSTSEDTTPPETIPTDTAPEVTPEPEPEPEPVGTTYIVNTNSGKFHRVSCSSVGTMSEANKWEYTGTREELIAQGYEPCKRCNP